ncbi:MAG: RNA methylase, partial [Bdellovibrionaceae bacterium]|nr:RNA methylase [Pseudobdellovibrionaceae bacterium]
MSRPRLDQKFWTQFAQKTWEKKTLILKDVDSSLRLIDAVQIFNLLVRFSDRCRKTKKLDGLKLYLDGERQYSDEILHLLPKKRDGSLEGYHNRMNEMFADYCLVCDELLQLDLEAWRELLTFTNSLHRYVGLPNRFSEVGLYLGNYKKTPFGVHVDNCGV